MRRDSALAFALVAAIGSTAQPGSAIVVRHDRDVARYVVRD
jgi:hypothetical protein